LDDHNKIVKESVDKHGGIVAHVLGDAHLVEFYSAVDATRCALDIQVRFASRNVTLPEDQRILVRIGLHHAAVTPIGQELKGEGIKILQRIEPKAPAGGVCLTGDV